MSAVDAVAKPPRGPAANKAAAKDLGLGAAAYQLYVLAPANDPYAKGTDGHVRDAEWFAGLWERFGYQRGVHLRRIHYQILSEQLDFADGSPYLNTEGMWAKL